MDTTGGARRCADQRGSPVASGEEPAPHGAERRHPTHVLDADVVLIATGARPRILPSAVPDGERILTWQQIYGLT